MVRKITVLFEDSVCGDDDVEIQQVTLIAPDIIVEHDYDGGTAFRIIENVKDDQTEIKIDLPYNKLAFIKESFEDIDMEWLSKASFLDVVRMIAK
ncbi:hypothetical protein ACFRCQ_18205 [Cytobacillus firmus]|uniref:hypothetical protein n=1 Tax=Cytobacillus firmus TaxID=1399 RepID=UPI0036A426D1